MIRTALATATALAVSATFALAQDGQTIRIATEGVYPPFNYVENGQLAGFDVDIANALCEEMKATCEIVTQDWDGMIPGLVAGKYDAIIASMAITEERKKQIDFSQKYYDTPAVFIASVGSGITETTPEALSGKIIGVQGSTSQATFLEEKYSDSEIRTYQVVDDANADLAAGRIDLVLSDKVILAEWLERNGEGCCEIVGGDIRDPLFGEGKGIGLRKDSGELKAAFDAAIETIRKNGTYERINAKYFDFPIY